MRLVFSAEQLEEQNAEPARHILCPFGHLCLEGLCFQEGEPLLQRLTQILSTELVSRKSWSNPEKSEKSEAARAQQVTWLEKQPLPSYKNMWLALFTQNVQMCREQLPSEVGGSAIWMGKQSCASHPPKENKEDYAFTMLQGEKTLAAGSNQPKMGSTLRPFPGLDGSERMVSMDPLGSDRVA